MKDKYLHLMVWPYVIQEIYRLTLIYTYAVILLTLSLGSRRCFFACMLIFLDISSSCVDTVSFVKSEINIVHFCYYLHLSGNALASHRCDPGSIPGVRWSIGHQVRQVGFLRVLRFPPTRRQSERQYWFQRAWLI